MTLGPETSHIPWALGRLPKRLRLTVLNLCVRKVQLRAKFQKVSGPHADMGGGNRGSWPCRSGWPYSSRISAAKAIGISEPRHALLQVPDVPRVLFVVGLPEGISLPGPTALGSPPGRSWKPATASSLSSRGKAQQGSTEAASGLPSTKEKCQVAIFLFRLGKVLCFCFVLFFDDRALDGLASTVQVQVCPAPAEAWRT